MKKNRPLFISITGNIGTGKTTVLKFFEKEGYKTHSADAISHGLLEEKEVIKDLIKLFGEEIATKNEIVAPISDWQTIDKKKLRKEVFNDSKKLNQLNLYMHKRIIQKLQEIVDGYCHSGVKDTAVIFEIPLLFECRLQKAFDLNIVIIAEKEVVLERIVKRDLCSIEEADSIYHKQIPNLTKIDMADIVIYNTKNLQSLEDQLFTLKQTFNYIKKRKIKRMI